VSRFLDSPAEARRFHRYYLAHLALAHRLDVAVGTSQSLAPYLEAPFDAEHQVLRAHVISDQLLTMENGAQLALGHIEGALSGNRDDQFHLAVATGYGMHAAALALGEIRVAALDLMHGIEL